MAEAVKVERDGAIGRVVLSRAEVLNALDLDLAKDLTDAVEGLALADEVRVVIITGEGRGFCAGLDLFDLGDFSGAGSNADSAYLLINSAGQRRVTLLARGQVAYDAIFQQTDFLARVPKNSVAKIQWITQVPQPAPDGDALLVVQNANDPTASLVLLRHGAQTYSARPADFTRIELASE
jgi:enoyl-CoA hydratase/carnithine racemase